MDILVSSDFLCFEKLFHLDKENNECYIIESIIWILLDAKKSKIILKRRRYFCNIYILSFNVMLYEIAYKIKYKLFVIVWMWNITENHYLYQSGFFSECIKISSLLRKPIEIENKKEMRFIQFGN